MTANAIHIQGHLVYHTHEQKLQMCWGHFLILGCCTKRSYNEQSTGTCNKRKYNI